MKLSHLDDKDQYAALHGDFHWYVPDNFNIAEVCCTQWAKKTPNSVAIREHETGKSLENTKTYGNSAKPSQRLRFAKR
jgi:acetyl-CoA synthetase